MPIPVPPGSVAKESLGTLAWLNLKGFSVTIPHKEDIIPLLSGYDKAVERLGACNTVLVDDGRMVATTPTIAEAMDSLESAMGGMVDHDVSPLLDKQVLILGAGGVARTIAFGLSRRGAAVGVCNHNDDRTVKLAEDVGCRRELGYASGNSV